jgi:hypothetical protein
MQFPSEGKECSRELGRPSGLESFFPLPQR